MGIDKMKDGQQLQSGGNNIDSTNDLLDLFDSSKINLYGRDLVNLDFLLPYKEKFSQIKILDLAGNNIKEIPSWIEGFQNLETLNLEGNPIDNLPVEILKLKNLKKLYVDSPKLKLPEWITELNLEHIRLYDLSDEELNRLRKKIKNVELTRIADYQPSDEYDDDGRG